jgi:ABC-type glycerol-3-phosphate transport system permease component
LSLYKYNLNIFIFIFLLIYIILDYWATMVNFSSNNNLNTNINIFETQLNIHNFNDYKEKQKLHPYFVTGYTDGDGSFSIRIRKSKTNKVGFTVGPVYSIGAEANIRKS